MADRYFHLDADLFHKNTTQTLLVELGPWAVLLWIGLIAQAKINRPPGSFSWVSDSDAKRKILGWHLDPDEIDFTFEEFLAVTGRLKQTRRAKTDRRRRGHVANVTLTQYGRWQKDAQTWAERERKARYRAENGNSRVGTRVGTDAGHGSGRGGDRDLELDKDLSRSNKQPARARGNPFYGPGAPDGTPENPWTDDYPDPETLGPPPAESHPFRPTPPDS